MPLPKLEKHPNVKTLSIDEIRREFKRLWLRGPVDTLVYNDFVFYKRLLKEAEMRGVNIKDPMWFFEL
jgi:hypothetical protein